MGGKEKKMRYFFNSFKKTGGKKSFFYEILTNLFRQVEINA